MCPFFFSNCRNPALKPRSRINPVACRGQANAAPYLSLLTVGLTWREVSLVWNIIFSKFFKQLLNIHFSFFPVKSSATSIGLNAPDFDSSYRFQNFWWGGGGGVPPRSHPLLQACVNNIYTLGNFTIYLRFTDKREEAVARPSSFCTAQV